MHEPQEIINIELTVNGSLVNKSVAVRQHLVDFLREDLGLTGAHLGCEHGVCGACTILMNGELVRGCLVLAAQANGSTIETVEGAFQSERLNQLVDAFQVCNAAQCGFCSPAMLLTAGELLTKSTKPSREEIREQISGNYCRCTGYQAIVNAVELCFNEAPSNE
jgi:aerobic carbon-monoxide dehydrogenase small subunit